jgi:hypothetical protein
MSTQTVEKNETVTTSEIIPPAEQNPPEKKQTATNMLVIVGILIAILIIIGLIGMIILLRQPIPTKPQSVLPPTGTELPMPTTASIQTPTIKPTISIAPTLPPATLSLTISPTKKILPTNPDGNTFTSNVLGISFFYSKTMAGDNNTTIKTLESGTKVYIYEASMQPTTGQSIEKFPKNSSDTLSQAISKKFLTGISTSDCFVKVDPKKPGPTITKATISYPIPTNADQPNFTYGEKCPEKYSESNGIAYFYEDSKYPDRFYFISIGQYSIPAYNSKLTPSWNDTIEVF